MLVEDYDAIFCIVLDKNYFTEFYRVRDLIEEKFGRIPHALVNGYGTAIDLSLYSMINSYLIPSSWGASLGSYFHCRAFKMIMQYAIAHELDNILVLEDDLMLTDNFDEVLNKALPDIPGDWDLIYYGANHSGGKVTTLSPNLLRLWNAHTTHMVGIRSTVFQRIIDLPEENTIDDMMNRFLVPNIKSYGLWPNAALQKPGYSNLQYHEVDYTNLFETKGEEL